MRGAVAEFNRTLDQQLLALARGLSLECLVCGEFVLRSGGAIVCPECGAELRAENGAGASLQSETQAG